MYDKVETLIQAVEQYATHELRQVAKQFDQDECFPKEQIDYLLKLDILKILLKDNFMGGKLSDFLKIIRILSQEFASIGSILLTQASAGVIPIQEFATPEQKQTLLEGFVSGKKIASLAIGERESGSHLDKIRTKATETDNGWMLEGEKITVSNAPVADTFLVVAKIGDHQTEGGLGIFIVDRSAQGLEVGEPDLKMGIKAMPVSKIDLKKVSVGSNALLGNNRKAFEYLEYILNLQRLMIAAQSIGIARGAMGRGLKYVTFDRRFGQRLIDLQNTQLKLAEVQTKIEAATAFLYSVASDDRLDTRKISMVKLMTSDMAIETTEIIMQVTGGYAYMRNNEIERFVRDAKVTAIYSGSSNTQKLIISKPWLEKRN